MTTTERLLTGYVPNIRLSYTALVLFGILAVIFWLRIWRQGRKFMLTLCISMTAMVLGCGIRIPMTANPGSMGIYIGSQLFTLLSPCGFIAQNYVILPRLATWLDAEDCLFLSSRKIVRIFVWSDVFTFWLQGGGSGITMMSGIIGTIGKYVCLLGLVLQFISFSLFSCLLLVFGSRVRQRHTWKWSRSVQINNRDVYSSASAKMKLRFSEDWRVLYYALIWTCVGILVRSVFRIAEYAEGYDGYLRTHEVFLYVFDSLPLFLAMAAWAIVWPPVVLSELEQPFKQTALPSYTNQHPLRTLGIVSHCDGPALVESIPQESTLEKV